MPEVLEGTTGIEAEPLEPIMEMELNDILEDFKTEIEEPGAEAVVESEILPIAENLEIIEAQPLQEKIISFFEDRIVLLKEPEAMEVATETLEEINEIILRLTAIDPGEEAFMEVAEKLEKSCIRLLEQLNISYSEDDIKNLIAGLMKIDEDPEQVPIKEDGFLHDLLHETKKGDGLARTLLDNPAQLIRYLAASPTTLGSLALSQIIN